MFLIVSKYLTPKGFSGLTLWPFILVREKKHKEDTVLINHEKIHIRQQIELLIVPFFLWYGIEFLYRYYQKRNWHQAYRNISFEREAYGEEQDLIYLKRRTFWRFLKYV
ncbi:hypothetical protein [Flavobacterium sp. '19STA2R22 D10 B1']|uniref:hypothetical protein n=1 Tax=Flavobacterium aerium TaxID=3037261 RepID=UPI00278C6D83|nr:hypothetical protein [Flavobacterium sp. '19STA2R22 D10 B1']